MSLAVNGKATGKQNVSRFTPAICSPIPCPPGALILGRHRVSNTCAGTVLNSLRQLGPYTSTSPSLSLPFSPLSNDATSECKHFRRRKALLYLLSQSEEESLNSKSCQLLSFFATQLISWFLKWSCSCTGWMCLNASLRRWGSADWWIAFFHLVLMLSSVNFSGPSHAPSFLKGNQQPV